MKFLKKLAVVVGVAALAATGIGIGVLVAGGASIGSAIGGGLAIGSMSLQFSTLATIGFGALAIGTAPSLSLSDTGANTRGNAYLNPDAPGVYVFGTTTVPSAVVYEEQHGNAPDRQITNVYAHAWHRIQSYLGLYIDPGDGSVQVPFSGNAATGAFAGCLWWFRALGNQTTALTGSPLTNSQWGGTDVGRGIPHSAIVWNVDDERFINLLGSVPHKFDVVVQGAWLYDPRLDSTVGGNGTQRFDNPATWSFNDGNAALVLLRYLIGEYSPSGKLIWGRGAKREQINLDSFMAMADVADEVLDGVPRFRLGGMHILDGDFQLFVRRWEEETGGKLAMSGGIYTCWLPHDDLIPLTTITAQDLLDDVPVHASASADIKDWYNTAKGRYIEPSEGYQGFPYPDVVEESAVTEDGEPRVLNQDFSWVQHASIAQRIARLRLRRSRFQRTWTVAMGWPGQGPNYAPFTVHYLNIPETGNVPQLVRVTDRRRSISGVTVLTLQQEDPSIYDETLPLGDPWESTAPPVRRNLPVRPRYIDGTLIDELRPAQPDADRTVENQIMPRVTASRGFVFRQERDDGPWTPIETTTDVTIMWRQGSQTLSTDIIRVTRDGSTLNASILSHTGDPTTVTITGDGEGIVTIQVEHDESGLLTLASVMVVQGGSSGTGTNWIFRRSPTKPARPTGDNVPSGWSDEPPPDNGEPLWASVAEQRGDGTTVGTWSDPVRLDGRDGVGSVWHSGQGAPSGSLGDVGDWYLDEVTGDAYQKTGATTWSLRTRIAGPPGDDGDTVARARIYRRSNTTPALPTATATYTFSTGVITGLNQSWSGNIPAGSAPLWVSEANAVGKGVTATIPANTWAAPVIMVRDGSNGVDGINSATVFLYQRNNTGAPPSSPTGTLTYTFSTGVLSGNLQGWSQSVPDESEGAFLWVTTAVALGTGSTDTIPQGEWASVRLMARDGQDAFGGNLFPDPLNRTFAINANGWSVEGGVESAVSTQSQNSTGFADFMLQIGSAAGATTGGILTPHFPVESGMFYRVGAWCGAFGTGTNPTTRLHIRWYSDGDATGSGLISSLLVGTTTSNHAGQSSPNIDDIVSAPSGARRARLFHERVGAAGHVASRSNGFFVLRAIDPKLIIDGAVQAKLVASPLIWTNDLQLSANGRIRRNANNFGDEGIFIGGQADNPQFSLRQGNRFFRLSPAGLEHNLWQFAALNDPGAEICRSDSQRMSGAINASVVGYRIKVDGSGSVIVVVRAWMNLPEGTSLISPPRIQLHRNGQYLGQQFTLVTTPMEYAFSSVLVGGPDDELQVILISGSAQPPLGAPIPAGAVADWVSVRARTELGSVTW